LFDLGRSAAGRFQAALVEQRRGVDLRGGLLAARLLNQRLLGSKLRSPAEVVAWLGAVQAQDYAGAKWAIGLRGAGIADADVERAFDRAEILRTHVLRPTWHFVTPQDIRWMLALTGPRVRAACASRFRELGLDGRTLARATTTLDRALQDGRHLTRAEIAAVLRRARISTDGQRLVYLLLSAELDGLVCSGPRRGKQLTYALLDDRAPWVAPLDREEALARLTMRYFASHGPATLRDYVWWAGLTARDAKNGIALLGTALERVERGGTVHWFVPASSRVRTWRPLALLLPNWDEYVIAYTDRRALLDGYTTNPSDARQTVFSHTLIVDGRIAGTWRRSLNGSSARVDVLTGRRTSAVTIRAIRGAANRYGDFLGVKKMTMLVHTRAGA
jgi:hypothetical protein